MLNLNSKGPHLRPDSNADGFSLKIQFWVNSNVHVLYMYYLFGEAKLPLLTRLSLILIAYLIPHYYTYTPGLDVIWCAKTHLVHYIILIANIYLAWPSG